MAKYTTIQGETWDQIALKVYGQEKYADWLMQNNYPLLDTLIFSAGTSRISRKKSTRICRYGRRRKKRTKKLIHMI